MDDIVKWYFDARFFIESVRLAGCAVVRSKLTNAIDIFRVPIKQTFKLYLLSRFTNSGVKFVTVSLRSAFK